MSCGGGGRLLLALPDDILALVTRSLTPRDVCNLSSCCRALHALAAHSEKVWLTQCILLSIIPIPDLVRWRKGVFSYRALCRFLLTVQPLLGIWVFQNPELGNLVYVMPAFISLVACRIIPQELPPSPSPSPLDHGPILWTPVFEILSDFDGSLLFLLHGTERESDFLYPGSVKSIDRNCNVLLLEVEPRSQINGGKLLHCKSFANYLLDKELSLKISPSHSLQRVSGSIVPFNRLAFVHRRKLIEIVTSQIRVKVPDSANGMLFPHLGINDDSFRQDMIHLYERRSSLMQIYKLGEHPSGSDWETVPELSHPTQLDLADIRRSLDQSTGFRTSLNRNDGRIQSSKRKTLAGYFRESIKLITGKSSSMNGSRENSKNSSSSGDSKYAQLHEFLRSGDTIGLTLHASTSRLSYYRAWPNMHETRYALYKLPMQSPVAGQEYAGLWGGTFGWPPGRPSADKPGKALFFLLLSYEESPEGQRLLIGTKILEGTHYVLHPNGSAMFIVNIDDPSLDPFPLDTDRDSLPLDLKHAFLGEGIANGYGFRYPGSKPGSLFVFEDGLLAFLWNESRAVLTLQRLNLQELLKKGERVPALPPIANFSYLTKSYSNVFAGFSNNKSSVST